MAEWKAKEKNYTHLFTNSKVLPGVEKLLSDLSTKTSSPLKLALASSAGQHLFDLKTSHIPAISGAFAEKSLHVFGDDPEMANCEKKPAPDMFLLALKRLNEAVEKDGERELKPEECLVFEDSIAGVEAARKANMRIMWVPHPGLGEVCKGREMDVLMGMTEKDGEAPNFNDVVEGKGSDQKENIKSEDGWAEMRRSLEDFPYEEYGIQIRS